MKLENNKRKKFIFYYFFNDGKQHSCEINADNRKEAVLKFFDKNGIAEFGCIEENGGCFTDDDYEKEKIKIKNGC